MRVAADVAAEAAGGWYGGWLPVASLGISTGHGGGPPPRSVGLGKMGKAAGTRRRLGVGLTPPTAG